MWDADTQVDDWYRLSEERRKLLDRVISLFDVPQKGVIIVIDNNDYRGDFHRAWTMEGFYLNIQYDGVDQKSPKPFLDMAESKKYAHLVWISRGVSEYEDIEFVRIVAHELQHLKQGLMTLALTKAGCFLSEVTRLKELNGTSAMRDNGNIGRLYDPTELDADLAGWRAARSLFGIAGADSYIHNKAASSMGVSLLVWHGCEESYDVFGETIKILTEFRSELRQTQKKSEDINIQKFDIDKACKELEKLDT